MGRGLGVFGLFACDVSAGAVLGGSGGSAVMADFEVLAGVLVAGLQPVNKPVSTRLVRAVARSLRWDRVVMSETSVLAGTDRATAQARRLAGAIPWVCELQPRPPRPP